MGTITAIIAVGALIALACWLGRDNNPPGGSAGVGMPGTWSYGP